MCMAAKTITIDMEAYELLASRKGPGESFSKVIKRTFRDERYTAENLSAHLKELSLSKEALDAVERVIGERDRDFPEDANPDDEP